MATIMTSLRHQLIEILADGNLHSEHELNKQLGITTDVLSEIIAQLISFGIIIHSVKEKNYQIPSKIDLLNEKKIRENLTSLTNDNIKDIHIFDSINSTNQYLLELKNPQTHSGHVCLAEHQSAARGRHGRKWQVTFATNIYFSLLWNFLKNPAEIAGLSLATAVAFTRTLKKYGIEDKLGVKWPNDVLWEQKKLAGILLEIAAQSPDNTQIVIGIGINVDIPEKISQLITQPYVDLKTILGSSPARNQFISLLLNELIAMLLQFQDEGLAPFIQEWQKLDIMHNKEVELFTADASVKGVVSGINNKGELLLMDSNQNIKRFASGEVSFHKF